MCLRLVDGLDGGVPVRELLVDREDPAVVDRQVECRRLGLDRRVDEQGVLLDDAKPMLDRFGFRPYVTALRNASSKKLTCFA